MRRFSLPPYAVAVGRHGFAAFNLSGDYYEALGKSLAPSASEARRILINLRRNLRWSRPTMAAFLGASVHTVVRWEMGERNPSGAARRLIWLLNQIVTDPGQLASAFDLMVWGQRTRLEEVAKALDAAA